MSATKTQSQAPEIGSHKPKQESKQTNTRRHTNAQPRAGVHNTHNSFEIGQRTKIFKINFLFFDFPSFLRCHNSKIRLHVYSHISTFLVHFVRFVWSLDSFVLWVRLWGFIFTSLLRRRPFFVPNNRWWCSNNNNNNNHLHRT